MSSRGRGPEWDDEDDWDDRDRDRGRRRPPPPPARTFGLPIVAAALLAGLVIGFIASCGGGDTKTVTETVTATAPDAASAPSAVAPSGPASRATIAVAILNGSGESGLAATRAESVRALGYANVTQGNAPTPVTSDLIVYRKGAAARAAQVAEDLGLGAPTLATAGDPILEAAPDASVFVVLGPTGASAPDTATGTTGTTG